MQSKGFTLIELVTVIGLMGILAAVASPRFANSNIFATRGQASVLTSSLRYAQKTALAQRRRVYVVYHAPAPTSVDLCFSVDCSSKVIDPVTGNPYSVGFTDDVSVSGSTLGFDALGRPVPNVDTRFSVTNAKNNAQSVVILVEAESGYIH